MLFSDKLLFIHVPKTGGMSVTQFLIDNIPGRITLLAPPYRPNPSLRLPLRVRVKMRLKHLLRQLHIPGLRHVIYAPGTRHEPMAKAAQALTRFGRRLEDFETIIAVVRNPYDLEVSRYHFLRLGHLGIAGLSRGHAQQLAFTGDFTLFARTAPYLGRLPARIEDWYEIDGRMPPNLRILRFETLEEDLERIVGGLYPIRRRLARLNASTHEAYESYLDAEAEEAIYRKYQWLFDRHFYPRERFPAASVFQPVEKQEHV